MALLDRLRDLYQEYDQLVRSEKPAMSEEAFRRAFDTREVLEEAIVELTSTEKAISEIAQSTSRLSTSFAGLDASMAELGRILND